MEIWIILGLFFAYIVLMYVKKIRYDRIRKSIKYKIRKTNQLDTLMIINEYKSVVAEFTEMLNERFSGDPLKASIS